MKTWPFAFVLLLVGVGAAAEPTNVKMKSDVLERDISFSMLLPNSYKTAGTTEFTPRWRFRCA